MTIHTGYLWIVLGMGLVTYLPRWFPLFFLARRNLPQWLIDWLDLIPAAILSALLVPELVTVGTPPPLDPVAAGALGGLADLCFCAENEIPGRYRCRRDGAVLGGPKGHVNTRVSPAVVFIFRIAKQYERLFAKTESLYPLLSNVGTPSG